MRDQLAFWGGPPAEPHRGMVERPAQADTSADAADAIGGISGRLRLIVLAELVAAGDRGLTDEEGIDLTGIPASTYRPRRVELCDGWQDIQGGFVRDSGSRRRTRSGRTAVVWQATMLGHSLTARLPTRSETWARRLEEGR